MPSIPAGLQAENDLKVALCLQSEFFSFAGEDQLAAGASHKIGIISTRNILFLTFKFRSVSSRCRAYIYENIAFTGGSVSAATCRNRENPKVSAATIKHGVAATLVNPQSFAIFGQAANGEFLSQEPMILKKNTPYVLDFINDANSQQDYVTWFCTYGDMDA